MDLFRYFHEELQIKFGDRESKAMARILIEDCFEGVRHLDYSTALKSRTEELVKKILSGIPIQYVSKKAYFYVPRI